MSALTKARVKVVADDLRAMLEAFGAKHGLRMSAKSVRYDETGFRVSVEAAVLGEGGVSARARAEFEACADIWRLKPEHFGVPFTLAGATYRIVGVSPRSRYAIICEVVAGGTRAAGTRVKWAPEPVAAAFAAMAGSTP